MCLYPRLIKNPKYKANKKNGGVVTPPSDYRIRYVPAGCGVCMECMKKKAREWQVRLSEEIKERADGRFITLTFNNESYEKIKEEMKEGKRTITECHSVSFHTPNPIFGNNPIKIFSFL